LPGAGQNVSGKIQINGELGLRVTHISHPRKAPIETGISKAPSGSHTSVDDPSPEREILCCWVWGMRGLGALACHRAGRVWSKLWSERDLALGD